VSRWLKVLIWTVVIAVTVVLLFTVVFPRVERILEDPTMGLPHPPTGAGTPHDAAHLEAQVERVPR
jgi:hypothetical protein